MKLSPDRLLPAACIVAATSWLTAVALRFPAADGDLLWQDWLGKRILHDHAIPRSLGAETFAASGAPWTPHEWLFSLLLAFTREHGAGWFVPVLCALAAGVALTIVAMRCRRGGISSILSAAAVLVCALSMLQSFGVRAQVLGWAGLSLLLWLLETEGPIAWLAVPVTVVWANLHASAFLSPLVAGIFAVTTYIRDGRWSRAAITASALAVACDVATLATPLGLDLIRYIAAFATSPMRHSISEWGATSVNSLAFVTGALPIILLLAAFAIRASLRDRVLACVFLVMLFVAVRNVPIFVLVTAPIAFAALPSRTRASASSRFAGWMTVAVVACAGFVLTAVTWRQAPAMAHSLPYAPARALLDQAQTPPRIFCEDFAWCSLFLVDGTRATFYMDGRADPYPAGIWREYLDVIDGNPRWSTILDHHRIDAVLVRRDGALDSLLAGKNPAWHAIAADQRARLYVRGEISLERTALVKAHVDANDVLFGL